MMLIFSHSHLDCRRRQDPKKRLSISQASINRYRKQTSVLGCDKKTQYTIYLLHLQTNVEIRETYHEFTNDPMTQYNAWLFSPS